MLLLPPFLLLAHCFTVINKYGKDVLNETNFHHIKYLMSEKVRRETEKWSRKGVKILKFRLRKQPGVKLLSNYNFGLKKIKRIRFSSASTLSTYFAVCVKNEILFSNSWCYFFRVYIFLSLFANKKLRENYFAFSSLSSEMRSRVKWS